MEDTSSSGFFSFIHEEIKGGHPDIEKVYEHLKAYSMGKGRRYFKSHLGIMEIPPEWEIIVSDPHPKYGNCVDFIHSKDEEEGSKRFPCLLNEDALYDMIRNIQCNKEKICKEHGWISPTILVKGKREIFETCFELVVDNYVHTLSLKVRNVDEDKKQIKTSPTYMHEYNLEMESVSENLINNSYQVEDLNVIRSMVKDLNKRIKENY